MVHRQALPQHPRLLIGPTAQVNPDLPLRPGPLTVAGPTFLSVQPISSCQVRPSRSISAIAAVGPQVPAG